MPAIPGNTLTDGDGQLGTTATEHLLHKEQHWQRIGKQGAAIKEGAVSGIDPHRQKRGAEFGGQFDKTGVPFAVANPFAGQA